MKIPIQYILIYLLIINIIGLLAMWIDKIKAKRGSYRLSEKSLFYITLLGGGIGTTAGMHLFRHKTKKLRFSIMFPTITIAEIILIIWLCIEYGTWNV